MLHSASGDGWVKAYASVIKYQLLNSIVNIAVAVIA